MGFSYSKPWFDDRITKYSEAGPVVNEIIEENIFELAEYGKLQMQEYVKTRPSPNDWSQQQGRTGRGFGGAGANDEAGDMYSGIDAQLLGHAAGLYQAVAGWIHGKEKYFDYQEEGFIHLGGVAVPAMNALRDMSLDVKERNPLVRKSIVKQIIAYLES